MINSSQATMQLDATLPVSWGEAVRADVVRTFPTVGGVSAGVVAAGTKRRAIDVAQVCAFTGITNGFVRDSAFPGPFRWSPPI